MSQVSAQGQDPSWISIPFEKYSHNTSRIGARKYAWSHTGPRNDLAFVIRTVRVVDDQGNYTTRVVLKVSAGAELLETQDLGALVACYKQFDPSLGGENPVQVVIRPPVWIAMAYPKDNSTVQRTQYKFFNEADFCKAVAAFKELGFSTRESPLLGPPRASTSSAPPLLSSSAAISVLSTSSPSASPTIYRPASTLRRSPLTNEILSDQPLNPPPFNLPLIAEVDNCNSQRRVSLVPFSSPRDANRFSLAKHLVPGQSSEISGQPILQGLAQQPSQCLAQKHSKFSHNLSSEPTLLTLHLGQTNFCSSSTLGQSSEHLSLDNYVNQEDLSKQGTSSPFFASHIKEFNKAPFSLDVLARSHQNQEILAPNSTFERPSSAPTDPMDLQDLAIPPKRIPPFPPPKKSRSASVADLPPLPKPTPLPKDKSTIRPPILPSMKIPTPTVKPAIKRIAQRKGPMQPAQNQPTVPVTVPASVVRMDEGSVALDPPSTLPAVEVSPLAAKSAIAARPSSAGSVLQTKATSASRKRPAPSRPTSAAKRPKMVDQSTQTGPYLNHAVALPVIAKNLVPELASAEPPASPSSDYLGTLDNFVTKHKDRPPPREISQTPEYLQASPEEREILISNFICQNLQSPEFIQLCKDMEHSWRRIGLGM